jgi:VanZ family protein
MSPHRLIELLHRHAVGVFCALYALLVLSAINTPFGVQVSLLPRDGPGVWAAWTAAPIRVADVFANIMLFIPFGALGWITCRRAGLDRVWSLLATGITAGLMSAGSEYLQIGQEARIAAASDVAANLIGAAMGVMVGPICHRFYASLRMTIREELAIRPRFALCTALTVTLIFVNLWPFDAALTPSHLARQLKSAGLNPLFQWHQLSVAPDFGRPVEPAFVAAWVLRARMDYLLGWLADAACFALLAGISYPAFRREYGFTRRSAIALSLWLCFFVSAGVTAGRLFELSRPMDLLFIAAGFIGGAFGLCVVEPIVSRRVTLRDTTGDRRLATGAVAIVATYVVLRELTPFAFGGPHRFGAPSEFALFSWTPLSGHLAGRANIAVLDLSTKFTRYAALAAVLAWRWSDRGQLNRKVVKVSLILGAFCMTAQLVHLWMPVRHSDMTNVLMATFAGVAGVVGWQWAVDTKRYADHAVGRGGYRVELDPTSDQAVMAAIIDSKERPRNSEALSGPRP